MKINDQQLGRPSILYCETHTNILAVPYPVEGMMAWDTTNHKQYAYNGTAWVLTTADWNTLENKPATFPPSAHTHAQYLDQDITRSPHQVLAGPATGDLGAAPGFRALVTADFMPQQGVLTGDPTGFTSPADVIVTYDPTTQKVTLTGTVVAYWQGSLIPILTSGWISTAHPNVTGHRYYLSYNGAAFVWGDNTSWDFKQLQIAYVNYGATDKYAIRECHGLMPWQAHEGFHETIGAYREGTGGALGSWVPASTTAGNRRPTVTAVVIHDEDCITTNPALTSDLYTQVTLTGAAVTAYTLDAAEIVPVLAANPYYNLFSTPNWTQVLMANNSYMCVWLVAVPVTASAGSQKYRYLWVQGQSNGNLASQTALTPADVNLGTLSSEATEFVFLSKIIIRYTGGNWDITSVTTITGSHFSQVGAPVGAFLTDVTASAPLTGAGTVASPLVIPAATNAVNGYATSAHISAIEANTAKVTNATHTGDVTGATALTIANSAVTLAKMANMATASVIGRTAAGAGAPQVLAMGAGGGIDADKVNGLSPATSGADAHIVATTAAGLTTLTSLNLANILPGSTRYVNNTSGDYMHIGAWGVTRTAATAVLVNTAYLADIADTLDGYHYGTTTGAVPVFTIGTYSPTPGGFSANPTVVGRYMTLGKLCVTHIYMSTLGTSNSTITTVTAPFTSANPGTFYWIGNLGYAQDNGVGFGGGYAQLPNNSTTITLYKGGAGGWTSSGKKKADVTLIYEMA